jgi:hypothetical protein
MLVFTRTKLHHEKNKQTETMQIKHANFAKTIMM